MSLLEKIKSKCFFKQRILMRCLLCFVILTLLGMLVCSTCFSETIPSSSRARKAIKKTTPILAEQLEEKNLSLGSKVFIRIFKESKKLEVFLEKDGRFELFKEYPICYFSGKLGPKVKQGDYQAPEGFYFVKPIQLNPNSSYHLSFNLGYPNKYDRAHGRTGSLLMVHGRCVSIGCYAMGDKNIEEIFTLIDGAYRNEQSFVRVHIFPFRMNAINLAEHSDSKWKDFWENLKEGYDYFEEKRVPPNVLVENQRYIFE